MYLFQFQMNIYRRKLVARLGLMHMIATNLCVWLSILIMETTHEIEAAQESEAHPSHSFEAGPTASRIQTGRHYSSHKLAAKKHGKNTRPEPLQWSDSLPSTPTIPV